MAAVYTKKQMGDACEMLVAAELTLAGVPALRVPDLWPGYDVIAQPRDGRGAQRVSVKSRTFKRGGADFVSYYTTDHFDWLAVVILPGADEVRRRIYVIPRVLADSKAKRNNPATRTANERYWRIDEIETLFASFENNFSLQEHGQGAKRKS